MEVSVRTRAGKFLRDHAAHGGAGDVRAIDVQVVEQGGGVSRHVAQLVGRGDRLALHLLHGQGGEVDRDGFAQVGGAADVAVVEADNVEAAHREPGAEIVVPQNHLRAEAHNEQQRRRLRVAERVVAEGDAVGGCVGFRGVSGWVRNGVHEGSRGCNGAAGS